MNCTTAAIYNSTEAKWTCKHFIKLVLKMLQEIALELAKVTIRHAYPKGFEKRGSILLVDRRLEMRYARTELSRADDVEQSLEARSTVEKSRR